MLLWPSAIPHRSHSFSGSSANTALPILQVSKICYQNKINRHISEWITLNQEIIWIPANWSNDTNCFGLRWWGSRWSWLLSSINHAWLNSNFTFDVRNVTEDPNWAKDDSVKQQLTSRAIGNYNSLFPAWTRKLPPVWKSCELWLI